MPATRRCPERSRLRSGCDPSTWQIELIDQVMWCSSAMRTNVAQKNADSKPCHDHYHRPSISAGASIEITTMVGKCREIFTMSASASRSGA